MKNTLLSRSLFVLYLLLGFSLLWIGARFLLMPEAAEKGFGLSFQENGNYAFHFIKGIRDIFSGLIICLLAILQQRKALGIVLMGGVLITGMDAWIAFSYGAIGALWPHVIVGVICLATSFYEIFINKTSQKLSVFAH